MNPLLFVRISRPVEQNLYHASDWNQTYWSVEDNTVKSATVGSTAWGDGLVFEDKADALPEVLEAVEAYRVVQKAELLCNSIVDGEKYGVTRGRKLKGEVVQVVGKVRTDNYGNNLVPVRAENGITSLLNRDYLFPVKTPVQYLSELGWDCVKVASAYAKANQAVKEALEGAKS
jgi:hypothetical protein